LNYFQNVFYFSLFNGLIDRIGGFFSNVTNHFQFQKSIFVNILNHFIMKKPKILQRAGNPKYIPGIYNYCDRWCERCSFTDRCMVFEDTGNISTEDPEQFWEKIHENFQQTKELLEYIAQEEGIDLDNLPPDPEFEKESEQRRKDAENNELSQAAKKYGDLADQWFQENETLFKDMENQFNQNMNLGIHEKQSHDIAARITDAIEVIRWYQHQIYVKIMRALSSRQDLIMEEMDADFPSDADGSVKVALIGMDNSIAAWGKLHECFPDQADGILDILMLLEKLRRNTENAFPKARSFVRPGFDD